MENIFRHPKQSLATKLIIAIGLLMIVGSFIFWYAILYKQEKDLTSIAIKYGDSFVGFVKESTRYSMLTRHREAIQQILQDIIKTKAVKKVKIFDHKGRIFYSSDKNDIGNSVNMNSIACKGCHTEPEKSSALLTNPKNWIVYKEKGIRTLKIISDIPNEASCYTAPCHIHPETQKSLGFVEADTSLALLDEARLKQGLALTGYVIIFFLAISTMLGVILWQLVSKPIGQLAHGMEKVAGGNLDYSVPISSSSDEIGTLAKTFNDMIKDLKAARDQRERWTRALEEEVKKKTEEIQRTHASLIQTEKLASLGRMAAGVAHELNNPLTGIVTFAHLMMKRVPHDSLDAEDLNVIIEQTERCAKIIKNLLTFARVTPSEKGELNINEVLSRTIYMVKNQEKFHNIKFDINIEYSPFIVLGDASQFQQIFLNMFINAADAMNERGTITVATRKIAHDDKPFVEIEFTDTGGGIPEEIMEKLFEPFFTTKPVGKGTGLGLSVSHGIVKHFGGHIDVKSTVGKGTSFFVRLPLIERQI